MTTYKSYRFVDGKARWIVVDEISNIVNINPNKEELKGIDEEYNKSKFCTDEELLNFLVRFSEENERVPSEQDFNNNNKYPSYSTYVRRFGSWNEALKMSGLQINIFTKTTNDKELLEYLIQFYKENGIVPIQLDFSDNSKYPSFYLYHERFGSWNAALKMVGLQPNRFTEITDNELLEYLTRFYKENGKSPSEMDFNNNSYYPGYGMYYKRFGSWQKALKLVELDIDTMIRKGNVETNQQKAIFWELKILDYLGREAIDVSGDNCTNPFDGICPKGQIYDAKNASLINECWTYNLGKNRGGIDYFYIGAFNEDYTKLEYVWRVPGNFFDEQNFCICLSESRKYNVENMKEYDITDKFKNYMDNI